MGQWDGALLIPRTPRPPAPLSPTLSQDSLFVKRPGDGPTEWHSDLNMAPFDTNDMVTCWIPLQPIPPSDEGGSALCFASASHRDFALSFWSDPRNTDLSDRYEIAEYGAFEAGDCTLHHGWCLHSAPDNGTATTRYAYAVSYVADGARLLGETGHVRYPDTEDTGSYTDWVDEVGWGNVVEHPKLPVVYCDPEAEGVDG